MTDISGTAKFRIFIFKNNGTHVSKIAETQSHAVLDAIAMSTEDQAESGTYQCILVFGSGKLLWQWVHEKGVIYPSPTPRLWTLIEGVRPHIPRSWELKSTLSIDEIEELSGIEAGSFREFDYYVLGMNNLKQENDIPVGAMAICYRDGKWWLAEKTRFLGLA